ncbi:MAG: Holliday junction branch migration protein RuvA [Candidatus Dojkabacteria bacterium]
MISYITGKILESGESKFRYVDILLPNGVGYRVFLTSRFKGLEVGSNVSLFTSFQVREDSQMLFGFDSREERDFFEKLLTVSGIGPKSALSILSLYSMEDTKKLVLDGDAKLLSKTPGLGLKGAQKVILELRGKIDFDQRTEDVGKLGELKEALRALGYSGKGLTDMVSKGEKILQKKELELEELIRKVLN